MRIPKLFLQKILDLLPGLPILGLLLCCASFQPPLLALAETSVFARSDYMVSLPLGWNTDNYILTQKFLALFDHTNIEVLQQIVQRGLTELPEDFPLLMGTTLALVEEPDARLFWLLSPLAGQVNSPEGTTNLQESILIAHILTGLPTPSLSASQGGIHPHLYSFAVAPRQKEQSPLLGNELLWERSWPGSSTGGMRAVSTSHGTAGVWGAVTDSPSQYSGNPAADVFSKADFFLVQAGIIKFIPPPRINSTDFYSQHSAQIKIQPLKTAYSPPHLLAQDVSGRQCAMRLRYKFDWNRQPPLLTAYLEQAEYPDTSSVTPGQSERGYLCQTQCVLTYVWDKDNYSLEGRHCRSNGD
jgi:hypothetical protein